MSGSRTTKLFERTRDQYFVSSDPSLLSLSAINAAFGTKEMYWATPLPETDMSTLLDNSFCFGLYTSKGSYKKQIGLARLITDHVTLAYLTDVYVDPEEQGKGLGTWLIECVDEWLKGLNHLRATLLVAGVGTGEEFYAKKLGMKRWSREKSGAIVMERPGPDYDGKAVE